jgi:hypothetical protein
VVVEESFLKTGMLLDIAENVEKPTYQNSMGINAAYVESAIANTQQKDSKKKGYK